MEPCAASRLKKVSAQSGSKSKAPETSSFFFWRVRSGGKRYAFFLSVLSMPPMLPRSAYREIEREDPGPKQVGLGYRAVSAVGVTEDVLVRFI